MSNLPLSKQLEPEEAVGPSSVGPVAQDNNARGTWHKLLRPLLIEKVVLVVDVVLITVTAVVCSNLYLWTTGSLPTDATFFGVGLIAAVNFAAVMSARRNYSLKNLTQTAKQARDTIFLWSGVCGLLAVIGFTMKISASFSRGSTILFFLAGLAGLLTWRAVVASFILRALSRGSFAKKKIIIIAEHNQNLASRPLSELQRYGYHPVQTCEISSKEVTSLGVTASLRAKLAEVVQTARSERIEDIYLLVRWHHHRVIDGILDALAVLPISVHLVPDEHAARFLNHPVANVGSTWTTILRRAPLTRHELRAKRLVDLTLAAAGVVFFLPLFLITALLIKLDSRGPVLFRQQRNGFNGQPFKIFKFRTMHVLEDGAVIPQAQRNDPRVTRLGHWLRRSSIDELPQLFNVIRGDMSLVGPRPHAASHNSEYAKLIANYAFRHHVKPGLTGWAQVNGYRGETRTVEQMERRIEYDLWYINNWSLLLDLRIILRTMVVALDQKSAY